MQAVQAAGIEAARQSHADAEGERMNRESEIHAYMVALEEVWRMRPDMTLEGLIYEAKRDRQCSFINDACLVDEVAKTVGARAMFETRLEFWGLV